MCGALEHAPAPCSKFTIRALLSRSRIHRAASWSMGNTLEYPLRLGEARLEVFVGTALMRSSGEIALRTVCHLRGRHCCSTVHREADVHRNTFMVRTADRHYQDNMNTILYQVRLDPLLQYPVEVSVFRANSFPFCFKISFAVFCPLCEVMFGFTVELFGKKYCFFFACKRHAGAKVL